VIPCPEFKLDNLQVPADSKIIYNCGSIKQFYWVILLTEKSSGINQVYSWQIPENIRKDEVDVVRHLRNGI